MESLERVGGEMEGKGGETRNGIFFLKRPG